VSNATCAVDDCGQGIRRRVDGVGFCNKHGKRAGRNGSPFVVKRTFTYAGQECSVDGCAEQPRRGGLCPPHSEQMRTHGDPLLWVRAPAGSGSLRKDGYRMMTASAHPLADRHGMVLEHRMVLFDKIGPGEHPCHWCGLILTWQPGITPTAIISDHLDSDRANNDPANLVPSCNPCNVRRSSRRH